MNIFPDSEYNFTTTLGVEEALQRFADAMEPRQLFRFFSKAKPFEGQIKGQGAEFTPVTIFRNSFRPFIRVNVLQHDAGSHIRVKMKLLPSVVLTLSLLCILPTQKDRRIVCRCGVSGTVTSVRHITPEGIA